MPEYGLVAHVTVSAFTTVEADSLEEAIAIAEQRDVRMGGINSGADENESWIVEEIDGEADKIEEG